MINKKLSYRRGTARRTVSVEILSTAAELHENIFEKACGRRMTFMQGCSEAGMHWNANPVNIFVFFGSDGKSRDNILS